ncbi:MAG: DUF3291 domain-containing protein [Bryobacteraceae bacterium]
MSLFHLAQINVARMLAPLDSPAMAGFVAQLAPVNAIADQSPGFVWRLQTENGDATAVQASADPAVIVNLSVWESLEALREFTYKSGHRGPLRQRAEWFTKPLEHYFALWWIPAGHIPTVEEAWERLEHRRLHGDTPVAFSFAKAFSADSSESAVASQAS